MDTRLLILAFGMLTGATDGLVIGSLLPAVAADTGTTVSQAGFTIFAQALAFAIGAPVLAALFGARDRRLVLASAAFVQVLAALAIAFATNLGIVIGGRVAIALASALYGTLAAATAVALSPPERRGRAVAVITTGQSLAAICAVPLAAWVAVTYGWRLTYYGIASISLITASMIIFLVPKGLTGETATIRERLAVLGTRGLPLPLLTTMAFNVGYFVIISYFLSITTDGMGLDRGIQPLALLAVGIGAVAGNQLGGQLADRLGAPRTLLSLAILQILLLASLPLIATLPDGLIVPVYFIVLGGIGLMGWAFYTAMIANIAGIVPSSVSLAVSLNGTALNLGAALAAIVGGIVLAQFGAIEIAMAGAGFTAVALVLLVLQRRQPAA